MGEHGQQESGTDRDKGLIYFGPLFFQYSRKDKDKDKEKDKDKDKHGTWRVKRRAREWNRQR